MNALLYITEAGVLLLDESGKTLHSKKFRPEERASAYRGLLLGEITSELRELMREAAELGVDSFLVDEERLRNSMREAGFQAAPPGVDTSSLKARRIELMVESGLAESEREAADIVRDVALALSEMKIREMSAKPDLQAIESVQALDEVDKVLNTLGSRVKEWYGLHFPELASLVDDNAVYAKIVSTLRTRENFDPEGLRRLGLSEKSEGIINACRASKGGSLREEDVSGIVAISEEVARLTSLRDTLSRHVDRTMRLVAPNVSAVAGPTIGARLIAKAGGLDRLARMPASTIQVLGAEKALFRALRTGTPPPKHGIIFQHQAVHSAPKWQRGKIARSLAAKIAIAARIDAYRGEFQTGLEDKFKKRLEEIRVKYSEPRRVEAVPRGRKESRGRKKDRRKPRG